MRTRIGKFERPSSLVAISAAVLIALLGAQGFAAEGDKPDAAKKKEPPKKPEIRAKADPIPSDPSITTAAFGDWVERCQKVTGTPDISKICEVAQTIQVEGQSSPIAQLAIGRLKKNEPLHITVVLPVNVAFPSTPKVDIGNSKSLELTWKRCVPGGCIGETTISDSDVADLLSGGDKGEINSRTSQGQDFKLAFSFRGLSQSLDALSKEN